MSTFTTTADIGVGTATTATSTEVFGVRLRDGGRLRGPVPGPALGPVIEPAECMALVKVTGLATALGSAPTFHERARPVVLAAPALIAQLIDRRTVPPGEQSPQVAHDPRCDARADRRMAGTSQGAARGRTALAVREVAVEADAAVAGDGVASRD